MAKKKFYAVRKGKTTGIFLTWDECKEAVHGYTCAEYKSFSTEEEAKNYLSGQKKEAVSDLHNQVVAYVDGSFDASIGRYAFGCVIILPNGEIIRRFGNGNNPESLALRNVTGEMLGAMYAVKFCLENDYPAIQICYDYAGIEAWATGAWSAKNDHTKKYAEFMRNSAGKINISFRKIAAHTGDMYNEEADKLAKRGLVEGDGIPEMRY